MSYYGRKICPICKDISEINIPIIIPPPEFKVASKLSGKRGPRVACPECWYRITLSNMSKEELAVAFIQIFKIYRGGLGRYFRVFMKDRLKKFNKAPEPTSPVIPETDEDISV